jgi:hypothetical protein
MNSTTDFQNTNCHAIKNNTIRYHAIMTPDIDATTLKSLEHLVKKEVRSLLTSMQVSETIIESLSGYTGRRLHNETRNEEAKVTLMRNLMDEDTVSDEEVKYLFECIRDYRKRLLIESSSQDKYSSIEDNVTKMKKLHNKIVNISTQIQIEETAYLQKMTEIDTIVAAELIDSKEIDDNLERTIRIMVIGDVNAGKSKFINDLLDKPNFVPSKENACTATICSIKYSERAEIEVTEAEQINFNELDTVEHVSSRTISFDGNQVPQDLIDGKFIEIADENFVKKRTKYKCLNIRTPHPLLKSGVELIDSPGCNDQFSHYTVSEIPNVDAVVIIVDATSTVTNSVSFSDTIIL